MTGVHTAPSDRLISWLRTFFPGVWAAAVAYAVTLGFPDSFRVAADGLGQTVVVPVALAGVYALLRWAEPRMPDWLTRVFFGSAKPPAYAPPTILVDGDEEWVRSQADHPAGTGLDDEPNGPPAL